MKSEYWQNLGLEIASRLIAYRTVMYVRVVVKFHSRSWQTSHRKNAKLLRYEYEHNEFTSVALIPKSVREDNNEQTIMIPCS